MPTLLLEVVSKKHCIVLFRTEETTKKETWNGASFGETFSNLASLYIFFWRFNVIRMKCLNFYFATFPTAGCLQHCKCFPIEKRISKHCIFFLGDKISTRIVGIGVWYFSLSLIKAWLPCWPLYSQQVSHQRLIWGSHKRESMQP